MFIARLLHMRAFNAFCVASLQISVFLATASQPIFAQIPQKQRLQQADPVEPFLAPPPEQEYLSPTPLKDNGEISPQFTR